MTWSDSSWRFACGDVFPYCGLVYDTQPSCSPSFSTSFVVFCLLSTRLLHFNEKTRASWVVATRRTHGYTLARSCCVLMYIFFLIKALLHVYCISFYRSYSSYWQVFLGSSYALFVLWLCCSDLVCLRIGSRKQKKKKIKYLIPTCWSPIILRRSCNLGSELWIFHFLVLNRKKRFPDYLDLPLVDLDQLATVNGPLGKCAKGKCFFKRFPCFRRRPINLLPINPDCIFVGISSSYCAEIL